MPELPEVEAICRELRPKLTGQKVASISISLPRIIRQGDPTTLLETTILSVERYGKHIDIRLDMGISLFVHLRMTGQLLWEPADSRIDRFVRAIFYFGSGRLVYRDVRTLGGFWISPSTKPPWKKLGPDPFSPAFTTSYLEKALSKKSVSIKTILLDQSLIAGIGNIYASEILFYSGIRPDRSGNSLSDTELNAIITNSRLVLQSAIDSKGTTFRDFRLSDGKEGEFAEFLQVYGHENSPCRKCNNSIIRIPQNGRSTYYCPKCQS